MAFWVLTAACALLLAGLAFVLLLRRPPAPLWPIVFVCQILALLWVLGDLWASHASSLPEKQVALVVLFSGSLWIPHGGNVSVQSRPGDGARFRILLPVREG